MNNIAIIGGTGVNILSHAEICEKHQVDTPYGNPSSALSIAKLADKKFIFLARHGDLHTIPPHQINYRANVYALKDSGANNIIAVNAAGGITAEMYPGRLVVPDQIIDYTYGREHTFYDNDASKINHIDFTHPYSMNLREKLTALSIMTEFDVFVGGVYAATQGPRLETVAEIHRLEKDGCDIVGMTGMPEAALARELGMNYICLALVVNWGAGKTDDLITSETIKGNIEGRMEKVNSILTAFISTL